MFSYIDKLRRWEAIAAPRLVLLRLYPTLSAGELGRFAKI